MGMEAIAVPIRIFEGRFPGKDTFPKTGKKIDGVTTNYKMT